jgi:predicted metalloprotease
MRWEGRRQSQNVEDRRSVGRQVVVGGGLLTLLIMVVMMFLGVDPMQVAQIAPELAGPGPAQQAPAKPANDTMTQFIKTILADNEDVWSALFPKAFGRRYQPPVLVLFSGQVQSACGYASAAAGPFYCPLDKKVYIDLAFYDELKRRFNAPGDFAQAYVIAHEYGHHVQNLLGSLRPGRSSGPQSDAVRVELQADCYAGAWAGNAESTGFISSLTRADIAEGLDAAAAVGDDRIQEATQGRSNPETFTHGTSEQRQRWFTTGAQTANPDRCDTFSGSI